jgi:hypothetical protein
MEIGSPSLSSRGETYWYGGRSLLRHATEVAERLLMAAQEAGDGQQ